MNKTNLKSYAPKARLDFIKAVTERANVLGISAAGAAPAQLRGDIAIIDGREWPVTVATRRDELIARIKRHGFEQTMDEVAYTWFNRFAALRYMEIHDYLDHGWRVLSSRDGGLPEILRHASEVTLPGLNAERAREMQLAGNQDNTLYKLLLVAQCNELSRVMPFLFERIDDDTELLLPENLLRTDSIVAKLIESVPEEAWQEIEVIGWLYQFYISDKHDQVIGKVVKSKDIPAATQLFTPNWIVQYLVQNSVGRLWLMANPGSVLASRWPYYIQAAEQTPEVQAQLDALIQTRIHEDGDALSPESITVLDPACGSGHILVVAYDVLQAIYLERGYQSRVIPRLILEKNLYGLDIDDRAAQLAAFALLMKARADDRRLFDDPPKLNVLSLRESNGLDLDDIARSLAPHGLGGVALRTLLDTFEHAKTFGSLIQIPAALSGSQLATMTEALQLALRGEDLYAQQAAKEVMPLVCQGLVLEARFDAVVANPPYMGNGLMNGLLKKFANDNFPEAKSDLFACFIRRGISLAKLGGRNSMITMDGWMFLSSYADLRESLLSECSIDSLAHVGWNCFPEVHTYHRGVAFVLMNGTEAEEGRYLNLSDVPATVDKSTLFLSRIAAQEQIYSRSRGDLRKIPGSPLAYWVSQAVRDAFARFPRAASLVAPREGLATGNNAKYVRIWSEVAYGAIATNCANREEARNTGRRWFPYNKGGDFRKWSGNNLYVVDWLDDGFEIQNTLHPSGSRIWAHNFNLDYIFRPFVTWSDVTSKGLTMRVFPSGYLFDATGLSAFSFKQGDGRTLALMAAIGNSVLGSRFSEILNPTLHFKSGNFADLPVDSSVDVAVAERCVCVARLDWNSYERSWEFRGLPLLTETSEPTSTLESCYIAWVAQNRCAISEVKSLEEENNRRFIDAYGLADELTPEVPIEQITLTVNPAYRYGGKLTEEEQWDRFRRNTCEELISYAIGCIMGRYSLDEPGLVYAGDGNSGFDASRYGKFPADVDGIALITDEFWFKDDAASRITELLRSVWGPNTLEENLSWLAKSLGVKTNELPRDTIRRYLAAEFFKNHLQTYKKRPIYWLFSSGKLGAFQALVYLHRYQAGTLARMRAEYVVPLIAKVVSRIDMLDNDVAAASSAAARTTLRRQIEALHKKQVELLAYDEKLRHCADMRITLDLDDGVKVNYAKFGDLVAEAKAITGGSDE